ncbi:hypothetical protein, conserved [Eimeria maxima]|uniref:Uncharacterized protein n=1 Tax=Eimeria maxima TaxID=5804 RepID=U6MDM3_EIMMA|nr:hypothetical protein, conserved [Eimeria maxima]CDJ61158.1 hypothetical protein, conserved [Eimeria maxima]
MVATAETPLNIFLQNPKWWPPKNARTPCGSPEVSTQCSAREASQDRIQQLQTILSEASFEAVGLEATAESTLRDGNRDFSFEAAFGNDDHLRLQRVKDVPPCFAPFTRFNCNVTLVAQKFFNSAMGATVLCSGTAAVQESCARQMLKHAKPGEVVYVRHVMLTAPKCTNQQPFSYGFLVARLGCLPQEVRSLVQSERMPFGAILDRYGIRRSVETDSQLHAHLNSNFFCVGDHLPNGEKHCYTSQKAEGKGLQGENLTRFRLKTSGDCQCKVLPEGSSCTFGRLTTVWCNGQPAARVVELLNERFVLLSLILAEKEHKQMVEAENTEVPHLAEATNSSIGASFQSRLAFLKGRCLMSVALCPVHYKLLPRPHVNQESLMLQKIPNEGCRLCGSKSCSTDFHSVYTADLQ